MKNKLILLTLLCFLGIRSFATTTITPTTATVCSGATQALTVSPVGGTVSSSNTSVATVAYAGGSRTTCTVTAVSAGTTTISYTASGITATATITVNQSPGPVIIAVGSNPVCVNMPLTLSDAITGGFWTSNNTSVATIGSSTGIATLLQADPPVFTYHLNGCTAAITETINAIPKVISFFSLSHALCAPNSPFLGTSIVLTDASTGANWSTTNTSVATITATGLGNTANLSGVSVGPVTVSYTFPATGCASFGAFTVYPTPVATTALSGGPIILCVGATIVLTDSTPGPQNGTWSSSNVAVGTVDNFPHISGISTGTTIITYISPYGCYSTAIATVGVAAISGTLHLCQGSTTTLTDVTGGGTWSSSNTAIATIGSSTGIITGVSQGTARITYTVNGESSCPVTAIVTVNPLPPNISGTLSVCEGSATTLSDASSGGLWSSDNPSVATIGSGTGIVTGVTAGTTNISYTLSTGCLAAAVLTVNASPAAINGVSVMCVGNIDPLSDATTGGAWSSSNTAVGTIDGSGNLTGISPGTTTVTYTLSGCIATLVVTVNLPPDAISGSNMVCTGSTIVLTDDIAGGTWSDDGLGYGSVDASGNVTGETAGTITISYSISAACYITTVVTINPTPVISGVAAICLNSTDALSDNILGGTWSSSNTGIGTVDGATGVVTGISAGTAAISYILSDGCYAVAVVTVNGVLRPDIGCYSDGEGTFAFVNDANGYSGITIEYSADITDGTTTVNVMVSSPLALSAGAFSFTLISFSDLSGGYTSPPWTIIETHLISVNYEGCTWLKSCSGGDRFASGGSNTTGIKSLKGKAGTLYVVPNPNDGAFNITGTFADNITSKEAKIEVVDMLGKVVYTNIAVIENGSINKQVALGDEIANGVYLIKVTNDNASSMIRLSLNR